MNRLRASRVAELIKTELSEMLKNELKDPRIGFVSITSVEVSNDLRHTKIFISVYGDDQSKQQTMEGLESAKGFIRSELGKRLRLRYTPEIAFKLDDSIEHGARIAELVNRIRE